MDYEHLRVFASLTAFPRPKSSLEFERVKKNMVRSGLVASDDSELSSVSSEELDIMGDNDGGCGGGSKRKKVGGVVDNLVCHDDKFPSDGEEEKVRKRRNNARVSVQDVIVPRGRSGKGRWTVPPWMNVSQGSDAQPYFPRFGRPMLFTVQSSSRGDSPPVPLGGFKSATMTRVNSAAVAPMAEEVFGGKEPRKRRPRLDASLKICRDFVTDVLSKKHKEWVWPLCKADTGRDAVFNDPIYLVDIKNKLVEREYKTVEEFVTDMKKLIGNYCRYYPENHQYFNCAKMLKEMFEKEFGGVEDENGKELGSLDLSVVDDSAKRGVLAAAKKLNAASFNLRSAVVGSSSEEKSSLSFVKAEVEEESSCADSSGKRGMCGDDDDDDGVGKRRKVVEDRGSQSDGGSEVCGRKTFMVKWLVDGYTGCLEKESLLKDVRTALGMDNLDMDVGVLSGLGEKELGLVGEVIFRGVMGTGKDSSRVLRIANEAISESQSDWNKMQDDLSSIRTNVYDTLIKINKMQECSFDNVNKLHERKNNL